MHFVAMTLERKSGVRLLLIALIFWKSTLGQSWTSQNVQPQQDEPVHKFMSSQGVQSSVLEATVNGSIPVEEVASNMLVRRSRSWFSSSPQHVKDGLSSSYESMSHTQSAPSASVSASSGLPQSLEGLALLLQLEGLSSPSVQDVALQFASGQGSNSQYASSFNGYGLQGVSAQLASASLESSNSSGLSIQSPTSNSDQLSTASTSSSSGPQVERTSSQQSSFSTGSLEPTAVREFAHSVGSAGAQMAGGSSPLVSTLGTSSLLLQSQSTSPQNTPGSSTSAKLAASPLGVSHSTSGQTSYGRYTSSSQSRAGSQLAASSQNVPPKSNSGSAIQPQGASSQYASSSSGGLRYQATLSGSSSSQSAPQWQSTRSQGFPTSSTTVLQGLQTSGVSQISSLSPSRFSSLSSTGGPSSSTYGSSLRPQGTSNRYTPAAALDVKVPLYNQAASIESSWSLSQQSQRQPYQASGTIPSQSSSPSQGSKAPSRLSTLSSAVSPGQFASPQEGSGGYGGLSGQSQSASSQSSSGSTAYSKQSSSLLAVSSQAASYPSSQSRTGPLVSGLSRYAPPQATSTLTDGSSLQLQGTFSHYAPAASDSKVPVYSPNAPSGPSWSLSQQSQWQPSASQGFQTAGTGALPSSSASQGSKAPSRVSTTSASSSSQLVSMQGGSGRYGLPGQSHSISSPYSSSAPVQMGSTFTDGSALQLQGISSPYAPASLDAKMPVSSQYAQTAPSGSSWSLSQQSQSQPSASRWSQGVQPSGTATSQSSFKAPSRLSTLTSAASPGRFAYTQERSGGYSGLSSQSQSASSQYSSGPNAYSKQSHSLLAVSSQSASDPSSQSRAGAVLAGSSRYVPMQTESTLTDGSSLLLQGTSSRYSPAALDSKVPEYSQAAPSRSSWSLSQQSQWQPSTSRLSQASGTVPSQSSFTSQGSKAPSRVSTAPVSSPSQSVSMQGGRYSGLFSQSQSASSQYNPTYAKPSSTLNQGFQASGTAVSQSSSSQSSGLSSFLPALSPPVAQSSRSSISTSRRTSNLFGVGLSPSKLSFQAPSGSLIGSQTSPDQFVSAQHPAESMTLSQGSSVQTVSQGMFSGHSSDPTSTLSGFGSSSSRSFHKAPALARYAVKG